MNTEKKVITCDLNYYQNDRKAIEMVFRHVRCRDRFKPFWEELIAQPDIGVKIGGKLLLRSELVYDFFKTHGFAGYFEKQRLRSWEQVVFFIEDRKDYYRTREIPMNRPVRCIY